MPKLNEKLEAAITTGSIIGISGLLRVARYCSLNDRGFPIGSRPPSPGSKALGVTPVLA